MTRKGKMKESFETVQLKKPLVLSQFHQVHFVDDMEVI